MAGMRDLKFVVYSRPEGHDKNRDLVAYQVRAQAARHAWSTKQKEQDLRSHGASSGQRKHGDGVKGPDAVKYSCVAAREVAATHAQRPLYQARRNNARKSARPSQRRERVQPELQNPEDNAAPESSSMLSLPTTSLQVQSWQPVLKTALPSLLPLEHNDLLPADEARYMLQGTHVALMRGFLSPSTHSENPCVSFVMHKAIAQRSAFEALVLSQLVRELYEGRSVSARTRQFALQFYIRTIQYVNRRMTELEVALNEDTFTSIISLALCEMVDPFGNNMQRRLEDGRRRPSQGPLQSLRMLDIYGSSRTMTTVHLSALVKMFEICGGMRDITVASAHEVSNIELTHASRELRRPRVRFVTCLGDIDLDASLSAHKTPNHPLNRLGQGFAVLNRFTAVEPESRHQHLSLRLNLARLALYTMGVHSYMSTNDPQTLANLSEQRNFVHHALLSSLPESDSLAIDVLQSNGIVVCAIVHLAAVVYSYTCVFPLAAAPFDTVAEQIQRLMQSRDLSAEWAAAPELYAWALFLVGIACGGPDTPRRAWVVALLRPCVAALGIGTWDAMKESLTGFLWLPLTNDRDGVVLWGELWAGENG